MVREYMCNLNWPSGTTCLVWTGIICWIGTMESSLLMWVCHLHPYLSRPSLVYGDWMPWRNPILLEASIEVWCITIPHSTTIVLYRLRCPRIMPFIPMLPSKTPTTSTMKLSVLATTGQLFSAIIIHTTWWWILQEMCWHCEDLPQGQVQNLWSQRWV